MVRPGQHGDALHVLKAGEENPQLTPSNTLFGVRIMGIAGHNERGTGELRNTGDDGKTLSYKAPGSEKWGPGVYITEAGPWVLEDGEDKNKWIRVYIYPSYLNTDGVSEVPAETVADPAAAETSITAGSDAIAASISDEYYTKLAIDAFFSGLNETTGKKQIAWEDILNSAHAASHEAGGIDLVNHDSLAGFVAAEHINHTTVSVIAGNGLTGGGTIVVDRTLTVVEGDLDHSAFDNLDWDSAGHTGLECNDVGILIIDSPTFINQCQWNNLFGGAGRATGGANTDAGSENLAVAAGTGFIKATDSDIADLKSFDWVANGALATTTDSHQHVGIIYNSGTPIIDIRATENYDLDTEFPLASIVNETGVLHILNNPWWVTDGITNIIERFNADGYIIRDKHFGGLTLSVPGTRNIGVTAGRLWSNLNEFPIAAVDTSVSGTFETYWYNGVAEEWNNSDVSQYPVTQYNDTSVAALQPMNNNRYANWWVYAEADDQEISLVYPQAQYVSPSQAEAEAPPTLIPPHIQEHAILIGRILFKKSIDAPVQIDSAWEITFRASQAADHGNLAGLSGDDHLQYLLIDGTRAMSGALDMGTNDIANVNDLTVSGTVYTNIIDGDGSAIAINNDLTIADGGTIGQSAGPLLTFNDTNNRLGITGCKVGINELAPQRLVHITGVDTAAMNFDASANLVIEDTGTSWLYFMSDVAGVAGIAFGDTADTFKASIDYNHNGDYLRIYSNSSERARIDSAGNFGIGTIPDSILHIKADVAGMVGNNYAGQIIIQNPANDVTSNAVITAYESDANGNPDQQLWYLGNSSSGNSDIIYLNRINAKLVLGTNNAHRITIESDGTTNFLTNSVKGVDDIKVTTISERINSAGITVNHKITATANTDTENIFGRTKLSSPFVDYAAFSHYDRASITGYALTQNAAGLTVLNAETGQQLILRVGGASNKLLIEPDKLTVTTTNAFMNTYFDGDAIRLQKRATYAGGGWTRNLLALQEFDDTYYIQFGAVGINDTFRYGYIGTVFNNAALYWDGNNQVGIGSIPDSADLDVYNPNSIHSIFRLGDFAQNSGHVSIIYLDTDRPNDGDGTSLISWRNNSATQMAGIIVTRGSSDTKGDMIFQTAGTTERVRINEDGNVTIGGVEINPAHAKKTILLPSIGGTAGIAADAYMNFYLDYDENSAGTRFTWYNHGTTSVSLMYLTEAGDLSVLGVGTSSFAGNLEITGTVYTNTIDGDGSAIGVEDTLELVNGASISLYEDITYLGATGENKLLVPDNLAAAWILAEAGNPYITIKTTDAAEEIIFGFDISIPTKISYVSVPGTRFVPYQQTTTYTRGGSKVVLGATDPENWFAEIEIPHGAIVTGAIVTGLDGAGADMTWGLFRVQHSDGSLDSMAADDLNAEDTSILNATVDNGTYSYGLSVFQGAEYDEIWSAKITYTLTQIS